MRVSIPPPDFESGLETVGKDNGVGLPDQPDKLHINVLGPVVEQAEVCAAGQAVVDR